MSSNVILGKSWHCSCLQHVSWHITIMPACLQLTCQMGGLADMTWCHQFQLNLKVMHLTLRSLLYCRIKTCSKILQCALGGGCKLTGVVGVDFHSALMRSCAAILMVFMALTCGILGVLDKTLQPVLSCMLVCLAYKVCSIDNVLWLTYHASLSCSSQLVCLSWSSYTMAFVPGGVRGVRSKMKLPLNTSYADIFCCWKNITYSKCQVLVQVDCSRAVWVRSCLPLINWQ